MAKYLLVVCLLFLAGSIVAQTKSDTTHLKRTATHVKKDTTRNKSVVSKLKKDTSHVKRAVITAKKDTTHTAQIAAGTKPDTAGMSPLKTMSYAQYKAYIDGVDQTNMAAVAELNHYPDPQKTLNWKKELALSATQITDVAAVNTELVRKMKEMGDMIVKNERAMDDLFRTKRVSDGNLIFFTNRFGLYQGEMKNAILQAYIKVQAILTVDQRKKYQQLLKG
jgi:hypothetical protein